MKIGQRVWLAPMGGEAVCAPLVAALIGQIRALTARPFGVKLFIPQAWRHDTVLTQAFSGRWARGLANRVTLDTDALVQRGDLPDFPVPNALTRPLRQAPAQAGSADYPFLWTGQALPLARRAPAAGILRRLAAGWRP